MKKAIVFIGSIVLTATISFSVLSCGGGNSSGGVLVPPVEGNVLFIIHIEDLSPEIDSKITLYRFSGGPKTADIKVENPQNYDSISWKQQDKALAGTREFGEVFTLNADNPANNWSGTHYITVIVVKDGITYNTTVSFKVVF